MSALLLSVLKLASCSTVFFPFFLHAIICQQQLSLHLFPLQDDRAALRHPIFQVIQLCCTASMVNSAAASQCRDASDCNSHHQA